MLVSAIKTVGSSWRVKVKAISEVGKATGAVFGAGARCLLVVLMIVLI